MCLKRVVVLLAALALTGCDADGERFVIEVRADEFRINGSDANLSMLRERLSSVENREDAEIVFLVPNYEDDSNLLIQGMDSARELGYGNVSIATPEIHEEAEKFKKGGGT